MKNIILFSAVTFFMVIVWIGFSIYHNQTSSTVAPNVASQMNPITPRFDTQVIESLRNRKQVIVSLNQTMQLLDTAPKQASRSASARDEEPIKTSLTEEEETPIIETSSESAQIIPQEGL
jgi:hypothetical protein